MSYIRDKFQKLEDNKFDLTPEDIIALKELLHKKSHDDIDALVYKTDQDGKISELHIFEVTTKYLFSNMIQIGMTVGRTSDFKTSDWSYFISLFCGSSSEEAIAELDQLHSHWIEKYGKLRAKKLYKRNAVEIILRTVFNHLNIFEKIKSIFIGM